MIDHFSGRVAIQQRVCPAYRVPFFDALAQVCEGGLGIIAGEPLPNEQIPTVDHLKEARLYNTRNLHFLDPSFMLYQCWQVGLVGWLRTWQPDALIVEANPRYLSTRRGIDWMHNQGKPVIGWGLGAPPLSGRFRNLRARKRFAFLKSLDGMIAYSQRGAQEYRALGFPADRVFVAINATSPRPVSPPPERKPHFQDRPVVLFVGRLQRRKRIDQLLRACAGLPVEMQPHLWIVGDGPARGEFQELAAKIYPQAEFSGAMYGKELDAYFNAADLFVLPGSGGLAVQQAMANALPVIVAQGDGTQDDLVRSVNGWSVPSDDLDALHTALRDALQNPAKLRAMGAASFRIVSEEVNLESMVTVFIQALNTIL